MADRLRGRRAVEQRERRMHSTGWLCERCKGIGRWEGKGLGRITIAKAVNHIVPLAHGGSDDDDNTENLCPECDRYVTAQQFGHRYKQPIGADGWPTS